MRLNNNTLAPVHCRIAERDADETNPDHRERTADEEVGRNGEETTGLAKAAQVCKDQQEEGTECHLHAPRQEFRQRRRNGRYASSRTYRGGEDVVEHQARRRHERRNRAKGA